MWPQEVRTNLLRKPWEVGVSVGQFLSLCGPAIHDEGLTNTTAVVEPRRRDRYAAIP